MGGAGEGNESWVLQLVIVIVIMLKELLASVKLYFMGSDFVMWSCGTLLSTLPGADKKVPQLHVTC